MRDNELTKQLKTAMGYRGPENCCKACANYVPTDCSGSNSAKGEHCTLNPAIDVPVEQGGWCKFHKANAGVRGGA